MKRRLLLLLFVFCYVHLRGDENSIGERQKICLNMIVKNEKDVIERCLASVKPFIDYWVIFDTGSTDGTQDMIKDFLKDIPGELHQSTWVNFAHNRNEALRAAKGKGDYLLFIDADEVWQYPENFTLDTLNKDFYYVTVRQLNAGDIKRIELVNNHLDWQWEGIIHEVPACKEAKTCATLSGVVNICNMPGQNIGARSKDPEKYLKDAKLLEKALEEDPSNSRYAFFAAQSYLNAEKYPQAIEKFKQRVSMKSSDMHETYLAFYNMAIAQERIEQTQEALHSYFQAYYIRPIRAEPLHRAAVLYRKQGNYLLGYLLTKFALTMPYPDSELCVEYMTYDYALLIEYANCTLLLGRLEEGLDACQKLINNPKLPEDLRPTIIANREMARKNLTKHHGQ